MAKSHKIAFFDVDEWAKTHIKKAFPSAYITPDRLTIENVKNFKDVEIISTFHTSTITDEVMKKMPKLKLITTRSTGFNHIDTSFCKNKKIPACNVPTYGKRTVAEHTFALILTLTRKMYQAIERTKREGKFNLVGLQGTDIFGKKLGIIGLGEIGLTVLKIAKGFGMDPIVYTRTHDEALAQEEGFEYAKDLTYLLENSDVITLHLPLTKGTEHIINKDNVRNIKKGAFLVNTARGGLIDTDALLIGLQEGILAGVGLDVLENELDFQEEADLLSTHFRKDVNYEDLALDHLLMHHEKVVITPHNAFNSTEARLRILETTFDNINNFIEGKVTNDITLE